VQDAKIVISAGKGIGKKEKFKMVDELADILGGAVGASRDVVDRGWKTYPHQIGLSGKTISPSLYIANEKILLPLTKTLMHKYLNSPILVL